MNIREIIEDMESDIKYAEDKGVTGIPLKNIKAWLEKIKGNVKDQTELDSSKTQRDLAFYAAKHTSRIEYYRARTKRVSDGIQWVITIGQGALRSGALINGGACVALLAFMGNIIMKDASMIPGLSSALLMFGCGVFFAAASTGTAYLAQVSYETNKNKRAKSINTVTIIIVLLSYFAFLAGGLKSYQTIHDRESPKTGVSVQQ
jgi:hypothetical protein